MLDFVLFCVEPSLEPDDEIELNINVYENVNPQPILKSIKLLNGKIEAIISGTSVIGK